MSNGTQSVDKTPPVGGPVDVIDAAIAEAKKKGEELVKDLADLAMQQAGPPGTPSLRKKG